VNSLRSFRIWSSVLGEFPTTYEYDPGIILFSEYLLLSIHITDAGFSYYNKAPLLPMMAVRERDFSFKALLLFYLRKRFTNIPIHADAPVCNKESSVRRFIVTSKAYV
jgi:hypothetical protein